MGIMRLFKTLAVDTSTFTACGSRTENEDAYFWRENGQDGVWLVADGLGGHAHGATASKMVIRTLADHTMPDVPDSDKTVLRRIREANAILLNAQRENPEYASMRTTIAALFRHRRRFRMYHVGDTRIYYFRNGSIFYQSKDHSLSQIAAELNEISPEQIRKHMDRGVLTKALGTKELSLTPKTTAVAGRPGDAFLLCSDGFWEYVLEEEMLAELAAADSAADWLSRMLVKRATRAANDSSQDNYTAIAGLLKHSRQPVRTSRV